MITDYDFGDPNRPALTTCVCGGQPQCFHDEETAFGVECYACGRHVSGYMATIDAITAWNRSTQKQESSYSSEDVKDSFSAPC